MKHLLSSFLNLLEKFSRYLERISRPMEARLAYFFCILQILMCVLAGGIALGFFIVEFRKHSGWDIRFVLIAFILIIIFMLGSWIHMMITRDLRHIKEEHPAKRTT